MNTFSNWISPSTMLSLGWSLLHFLWQGTALAALAAAAMALLRRPSSRYLAGVVVLILMLAAPVATFVFYSQRQSPPPQDADIPFSIALDRPAATQQSPGIVLTQPVPAAPAFWSSLATLPWLVEAWLLGVAFLSLRSAGGFILLERQRRKQASIVSERVLEICYTLQDRLGLQRAITYCECRWLQAPGVIGWFRPVVFLPVSALTGLSEEQLEAVIAHELAHIRRFDPFVNVFQVFVETLLFYHPAIWWLNRRIRVEREHCCDDLAVELCGNAVEYARALTLMEAWRSLPVFAMALNRGPLKERVVRVLGLKTLGAGTRGIGLSGSILCLTAALFAGHALLGMGHLGEVQAAPDLQAETKASEPRQQPAAGASPAAKPSPARRQSNQSARTDSSSSTSTSYIDGMKSVGLSDLTVDQLIALKIQDVTPEYVREMREQGLNLDVNNLIAMRVQGIGPEYVKELQAAGLRLDANQIVALKVQGADADYYHKLVEAGIQPDINQLIGLKVQGVTPEYVRELSAAGLALTADKVIALKVQGVSADYLKALHAEGIDPRADDAIALKVQDVTPEYIRGIQALGLKPTTSELIALRVQDVTPDYIKALQNAGFKLSVNDLIGAKVQDVTPEFIERAQKHGFKDLTLQKLIQLRQLGILDSKADL